MFLRSGRQIALRRLAMGISGYELAKMVGTKRPNLSSWESGKQLPGEKFINNHFSNISKCLCLSEDNGFSHILNTLNFEKYIFNISSTGLFTEAIKHSMKLALAIVILDFSCVEQSHCKIVEPKSNFVIPKEYEQFTNYNFNWDIIIENDIFLLFLNEIIPSEGIAKKINKVYSAQLYSIIEFFDVILQENRRKKIIKTPVCTLIENLDYSQIVDFLLYFFYSIKFSVYPDQMCIEFLAAGGPSELFIDKIKISLSFVWNYEENCLKYEITI